MQLQGMKEFISMDIILNIYGRDIQTEVELSVLNSLERNYPYLILFRGIIW